MKKISYLLGLLTAIMLFAASCGKDGAVGPTGPSGATGSTGAVGPAGPPGANGQAGSVIYSGTTVPPAATGTTGDFYLNLTTGLLYGPKTASGWGAGFSLVGPAGSTGATGAAGSAILSGIGSPSASAGVNGDFYLDKANYLLYGPKTGAGWGAAVSFKGATGPQGPPGTANVQYTDWLTPATYVKDTVFGSYGFYHDLLVPAITQAVVDKGTVIVYGRLNGYNPVIWPTNQVSEMPIAITYMVGSTPNIDTWSALTVVGKVRIQLISSLNQYGAISNAHQFRVVIIPGGVNIPASLAYVNLQRYLRIQDRP